MCLKLLFAIFICLVGQHTLAQTDSAATHYKGYQARLHYGFIIAHSQAVQNTAGAHPRGIELEILKQKADTASWDLCHCYPTKGFTFSYFDFNNTVIGHGFTGAYFLEPAYRISKKIQFRFRGSGGLSYLTNPYHATRNPTNMSYSFHIGGFLQLGVSTTYTIASKWLVQMGANYQHISNGGLKEPNKGINWPTASIGVSYFPRSYNVPNYKRRYSKIISKKMAYYELATFLSAKQGYQKNNKTARTPLIGLLIQGAKQLGNTNAVNTGIEFYFDNALHQRLKKDSVNGSAFRIGLLAGHDFLLGRFFFSQQLGVYLFSRNPYYDRIYHRWALRYMLKKRWMVGIELKAHRQVADFIDLRLIYKI